MEITVRSNTKEVKRMFDDLEDLGKDVMKDAYKFYKQETPIQSGNARNKTKLKGSGKTIDSAYPYAGRLDEGWSKQAPKGMTKPTIDKIESLVDKEIRRVSR